MSLHRSRSYNSSYMSDEEIYNSYSKIADELDKSLDSTNPMTMNEFRRLLKFIFSFQTEFLLGKEKEKSE